MEEYFGGVSRLCSGSLTTMVNVILSQRYIHSDRPEVAEIVVNTLVLTCSIYINIFM